MSLTQSPLGHHLRDDDVMKSDVKRQQLACHFDRLKVGKSKEKSQKDITTTTCPFIINNGQGQNDAVKWKKIDLHRSLDFYFCVPKNFGTILQLLIQDCICCLFSQPVVRLNIIIRLGCHFMTLNNFVWF